MRRHMKVAIAIPILSLFALVFWQTIMSGKDAAVADAQRQPEHVGTFNPHLPIQRLAPLW